MAKLDIIDKYILSIIIVLMNIIGIVAGLSLAFSIGVFFVFLGIKFKDNIIISYNKILILALLWFFISCFWSPDILLSLEYFFITAISTIFVFSLIKSLDKIDVKSLYNFIIKAFIIGLLLSIVMFFIEYYTKGFFAISFRKLQEKDALFSLYFLDRGCAFLSVLAWFVIDYFIKNDYKIRALALYLLVFLVLFVSDSLAAFVGFVLASITVCFLYLTKARFINLLRILMAIYFLLMPITSFYSSPRDLSDKYSIPDSAKHRLFIWNFVAQKSFIKPIIGYGFSSSKYIAQDEDFVKYKNYKWSLLPLHPHNNVLQVLLESGIIGLIFFWIISDKILKIIIMRNDLTSLACFINYFFVGMVGFGIWQTWWFFTGLIAFFLMSIKMQLTFELNR